MLNKSVMRMYLKYIVIYCVVNKSLVTGFGDNVSRTSKPYSGQSENRIPGYIQGILGVLSILLLLVSAILVYVLVKTKFLQTVFKRNEPPPSSEKVEDGNVQCQTCQKSIARTISLDKHTSDLNANESVATLKRQESEQVSTNDCNTLRSPKKPITSGQFYNKSAAKDLPYIKPEQMTLICKEVLKRKVKTDSRTSLQNIDKLVNEDKPKEETSLKCASTPILDLCDTTPSTPKSEREIQAGQNNGKCIAEKSPSVSKRNEGMTNNSNSNGDKEKQGCDIYDFPKEHSDSISIDDTEEHNCEIYDFPKEHSDSIYDLPKEKNIKVENQSGYFIPFFDDTLSKEGDKTKEEKPTYAKLKEINLESGRTNELKENRSDSVDYYGYDDPKRQIDHDNDANKMYINANDIKM